MKLREISIPSWTYYPGAVGLVALAAGARLWPMGSLHSSLAWVTFYPAVALAAIYGGGAAGLLATALSCLTVAFLWPLLVAMPFIQTPADGLGMLFFACTGAIISAACDIPRGELARMEMFHNLVIAMDDGFCIVEVIFDLKGKAVDYRFLELNQAFAAQTGLADAKGRTMRALVPNHEDHWFEIYGKVALTGEEIRFENPATAMGKYYDVFAFRVGGRGSRKVGISFKDISQRRAIEAELLASARYDGLTGLPNRKMFHEYFAKALARAEREQAPLSLMFLDLNGFKAVNDTRGHHAGDHVLRTIGARLLACMRSGDLVARLGGDEFIIIVENCPPPHLPEVATKVLGAVEAPIDFEGEQVMVSGSLGVSTYPECGEDAETLIRMADAAMYESKKRGGWVHGSSVEGEPTKASGPELGGIA